jgi:hypothetical protein
MRRARAAIPPTSPALSDPADIPQGALPGGIGEAPADPRCSPGSSPIGCHDCHHFGMVVEAIADCLEISDGYTKQLLRTAKARGVL